MRSTAPGQAQTGMVPGPKALLRMHLGGKPYKEHTPHWLRLHWCFHVFSPVSPSGRPYRRQHHSQLLPHRDEAFTDSGPGTTLKFTIWYETGMRLPLGQASPLPFFLTCLWRGYRAPGRPHLTCYPQAEMPSKTRCRLGSRSQP